MHTRPQALNAGSHRPSLIVHGDHQAAFLVACLCSAPEIAERYEIAHLPHGQDWRGIEQAVWRRCAIFWRQVGGGRRQARDDAAKVTAPILDPRCMVISWPALWFPALWPHRVADRLFTDPTLTAQREDALRFAYSDRLLMRLSETDLAGPALFARYRELDAARASAAERVLELGLRRIFERDRRVRVPMGGFIASHYRTRRLFTAVELPTSELMRELLRRLARATWPEEVKPGGGLDRLHLDCPALDPMASPARLLRAHDDPVSPGVAAVLGLAWWDPDDAYLMPRPGGGWHAWLLPDFVAAHVEERRSRMRLARPVAPAPPAPRPRPDGPRLLAESHALLANGDADGAIAVAEAACAAAPEDVAAAVHHAYLVASRRPPEEAERACRRALALAPDHAGANHAFSLFCTRMDRLPEAIAAARKAALGAPRNFHTSAHLGNLLRRSGDVAAAESAYRLALVAAPDQAELHVALGDLYAGQGLWQDAVVSARRAVALAPDHARAAQLLMRATAEVQGQA